jgi:hypothetical protein
MSGQFYTLKESYTPNGFKDESIRSTYDFSDRWKANPLSDKVYINANIAGYKPSKYETYVLPEIKPVKQEMIVTHAQFMPQDYPFMYPCTTIYPKNKDYTSSKYIVTQP